MLDNNSVALRGGVTLYRTALCAVNSFGSENAHANCSGLRPTRDGLNRILTLSESHVQS